MNNISEKIDRIEGDVSTIKFIIISIIIASLAVSLGSIIYKIRFPKEDIKNELQENICNQNPWLLLQDIV